MTEFTEEMMKGFSEEAIPAMEKLAEIAKKHGVINGLTVWYTDNYISINGAGLGGWELYKINGRCRMSFNKTVILKEDCEEEK